MNYPAVSCDSNATPHKGLRDCRSALIKLYLLIVMSPFLCWQTDVVGEAPDTTLVVAEAALAKLDATNLDDDWYFTMDLVEEDELRVIHSDPHRDNYEKRQLVTVNGAVADSQRQKEFRQTEVKRIDELDPDAAGYRYMVNVQTLQLIEQGDGYAKLSFVPRIKAMEKSRDQVRGTVLLNMETKQVEEIEIHNTDKLSPAFSVTVDTYRLVLKFQQEQGENLLKKLESRAVGKAGFLKGFDALVVATFSDYKRAEP